MKSTIEFLASAGSAVALSLGFQSLAEKLDPVSSLTRHTSSRGVMIDCTPYCNAEEIA